MRFHVQFCLIMTLAAFQIALGEEPKYLTPEQLDAQRPIGEVTLKFKVAETGWCLGGISLSDPPCLLEPKVQFKDKHSRLQVFLVGKCAKRLNELAIDSTHFEGKTVYVTGTVRYKTKGEIRDEEGNLVKLTADYCYFEFVVDDLDHIKVLRDGPINGYLKRD